jgi:phytoene dehydrogenase-like protein
MLENGMIHDRYEVVVVGGGIGGLTAAALLANKGLQVLVVEQHYIPGGCCTTLRRKDVSFDIGAALLYGFGEKGYNPHRYVMNELEEEIDMIRHDSIFRVNFDQRQVTFWLDFERYFQELVAAFPHEEKGLRALYRRLEKFYRAVIVNKTPAPPSEIHWADAMKGFFRAPLGTMQLGMFLFKNTRSILEKYISDPDVIGFFNVLMATMFCCTTAELPVLLSSIIIMDSHVGGAYYPVGSPQTLPNKLERALERKGGQVLYRHLVEEIIIEGRTAKGVRLDDGTVIRADHVVSDATVWNLYGNLIKPEHIKPERIKWAQSFVPTFSVLMLYIGVDKEAIPEDTRPIEFYVADWHNLDSPNMILYIPSLDDPSICPPDAHSMTLAFASGSSMEGREWPRPGDPSYQSEGYYEDKKKAAEKALDHLEVHFPNLRKHIRVLEVGTPATVERFTLRKKGCVGGPKQMMGQEMLRRLKARSEWKNLYLCGDSTVLGEGVVAVTSSAVGAANMVLRDRGRKEYRPQEHSRQFINLVKGRERTPLPPLNEPVSAANAGRLAQECQLCENPGCKKSCPAGIDVLNFVRRIEAGNFAGAARAVREMNPLAEICGRVCPSERFCEKECNRHDFSQYPTRIRELHGWVAVEAGAEGWSREVGPLHVRTIAVVGGGPAGLTCAHYLARLGYQVDIYEQRQKPGGMISHAIPDFRLPNEVVQRELDGMMLPNMRFKFGRSLGKEILIGNLLSSSEAVFLAPGLGSGRILNLPGREDAEIVDALSLLGAFREQGRAQVKNRVLVIGGGSVAADAALTARKSGAARVTLVCLEKPEEMPALPGEVTELKKQGVEINYCWGPRSFLTANKLSFVACRSVFDSEGKFCPVYDESQSTEIEFDQVVMAVGQAVEPGLAAYLKEEFGGSGRLEVDEATQEVKGRPGVYAGGDIVRGAGTVVQAVADGRRAARAIALQLL